MSKSNSTDEFKRDAVGHIKERGYPVAEVLQQRLAFTQSSHDVFDYIKILYNRNANTSGRDAVTRRVR